MSLLRCPDCGGKVSNSVSVCPRCGRPLATFKASRTPRDATNRTCRINGQVKELKKIKNDLCKINGKQYNLQAVEETIRSNNIKNAEVQIIQITNLSFAAAHQLAKIIQKTGDIPREFDPVKYGIASNVPKCPTCGSTNIEKITAFDRGVAAGVFGMISKTARSQFRCRGCGYLW